MSSLLRTFLEGLVDADLPLCEVFVALHIGEHTALVDPVIVMGPEEENGEITNVVFQTLDVGRDQARITDLSRPPPTHSETHT